MCFGGAALKCEGGRIFWFESFQTGAKIARFAKLAHPAFNMSTEMCVCQFCDPSFTVPF